MNDVRDGAVAVVTLHRLERRNAVDLPTARVPTEAAAFDLDHVQLAMPVGREDDARAFYVGRLVARLAGSGVNVTPDPLPFEGKPHVYLEDPFGNRIEIISNSVVIALDVALNSHRVCEDRRREPRRRVA